MELDNFDLADDLGDLDNIADYDWDNLADSGHRSGGNDNILNTFEDNEDGRRGSSNGDAAAAAASADQIRLDRERDGRCADCGAQTHEIQLDASGQAVKLPLSVPGEVHRGRCLFCHPLPNMRRDTLQSSGGSVCTQNSQQSNSHYSQHSAPAQWGHSSPPYQQRRAAAQADLAPDFVQQQHYQRNQHLLQQHNQHPDDGSVYSNASHASRHFQDPLNQSQHTNDGSVYSNASHHSNQYQQKQPYADDGSVASHHSHHSHHSQASYHSFSHQQQFISPQQNRSFHRSTSSSTPGSPEYNTAMEAAMRSMQDDSLGFEHVIQAMQQFSTSAIIQERGCTILLNQTYNADVCHMLASMGGVPTILQAMRNHPSVTKLQHTALEVIRNLCVNELNRQSLLQSGGLPLVVDMMQKLVDDAEIQRSGCNVLASVAQGGMEFKIGVAECGGILAVMKAVESHPDNDNVLRAAYQALRLLGYNPGGGGG